MGHIKGGNGGGGPGRSSGYPNIDKLGSDKAGFRLWHERFINELIQVQPATRIIIRAITSKIDLEEKMINMDELLTIAANHQGFNATKFCADLYPRTCAATSTRRVCQEFEPESMGPLDQKIGALEPPGRIWTRRALNFGGVDFASSPAFGTPSIQDP